MRIVHFHSVHGSAVVLSEDNLVATRTEDFCNGIAFSAQPVKPNQKVCLELTHSTEWSGAIRIGVTTIDPQQMAGMELPRYVCPDLTNKEGYWARALNENYADSGNRVTFYVNSVGQMHYFVNNEHKGMLLNHLPTNVASAQLLRRLGFTVDGYARDYLYIDGAWRDHVLTSITSPSSAAPREP